ncbi:MAG: RloB domain-containing protein [Candidatus Desulfofervidaceae bacterium]|nr:RloB domain-containing protein [Candidatus Desulfofervidaceae bacterium]
MVIEGETERWYLQLMQKHENLPKVAIKPELPKKKKLNEIKALLKELLENGYDKIFWLVDLDAIITHKQHRKLQQIIDSFKKKKEIEILINNPCLEFWYLLHFCNTGKGYSSCDKVVKEIRKKCKPLFNYQKSERYYKSNPDIYERLKKYQKNAMENAKDLISKTKI